MAFVDLPRLSPSQSFEFKYATLLMTKNDAPKKLTAPDANERGGSHPGLHVRPGVKRGELSPLEGGNASEMRHTHYKK